METNENNSNNKRDSNIIIPENGIFAQNDDALNLFDPNMEEYNLDNIVNNENDNQNNDDLDDGNEDLEEMKEGFSSQKERTEELDKMLLDAKQIAKDKSQRNQNSHQSRSFHFLKAQSRPSNFIIFS